MIEQPIVRYLIPCDEIQSTDDGKLVIANTFHAIRLLPDADWPQIQPVVCFFALLTNGRGEQTLQIEQTIGFGHEEQVIYRFRPFVKDLGTDPVHVHGMPIRLNNVLFPQAGQYLFRILCNGEEIADAKLEVRNAI